MDISNRGHAHVPESREGVVSLTDVETAWAVLGALFVLLYIVC